MLSTLAGEEHRSGVVSEAGPNIGFGEPGVSGDSASRCPLDADAALVAVQRDPWSDLGVGVPDQPDQNEAASFVQLVLAGSRGRPEGVEWSREQAFGHSSRVEHMFE